MRFGLILPNYGTSASPARLLSLAREAERLGFDSAWTTDHILLPQADAQRFGRLFEALTTLAFLAGATTRLRLGVSTLVLPQRDPVLVAKQVAALDALSGGRAMLSVGVGWSQGEYANLGQRFENRGRRMDEAIKVLRLLLTATGSRPLTFRGEFYQFEDGVFAPLPAQAGGPPLWVAGNSEAAVRRAALLGDGWHPTGLSPEDLSRGVSRLRALAGERPLTVSLRVRLSFSETHPSAPLQGSPHRVAETLGAYQSAGLDYPVIDFQGETHSACKEAMGTFVDEVIPALGGEAE
jgi:probable F420-dependent oxidoreductase